MLRGEDKSMGRKLQMVILLLLAVVEGSQPLFGSTNGKVSKPDVKARKEAHSRLMAKLSELGFDSPFPSKANKATVPSKLPSQRIPRLIHQTYKSHDSLSPELWASINAVKRANPESVQSIILQEPAPLALAVSPARMHQPRCPERRAVERPKR
jgi:hypothetical protein